MIVTATRSTMTVTTATTALLTTIVMTVTLFAPRLFATLLTITAGGVVVGVQMGHFCGRHLTVSPATARSTTTAASSSRIIVTIVVVVAMDHQILQVQDALGLSPTPGEENNHYQRHQNTQNPDC